jgi:hypothetical protein
VPAAAEPAEAAGQRYLSLLPPFLSRPTRLEEHGPGLWALVQPLPIPGQFDVRVRMTIARLDDGSLLVKGGLLEGGWWVGGCGT